MSLPAAASAPAAPPARGLLTRTGFRLPFLLAGGLALLAGLDAGMSLLGLPQMYVGARLVDVHGPLMVLGFVGTLVSLERSVALGRAWGYLAPAASGLGALAVVLGVGAGPPLLVLAQLLALLVYRVLHARQPATAVAVQVLGSAMALGGALLWWAGVPVPDLVPWLVGYLVLTILGERIELARIESLSARGALVAQVVAAGVLAGAVLALLWPDVGFTVLGCALVAAAGWLVVKDVARRTIFATGLPRFIAGCLLAGYAWLALAGGLWATNGQLVGRGYDAVLHAVFLGFIISMIMAHAPVIMPAVLRRPLPYRPAFVAPAVALHASLLLRLAVGDARDLEWAVQAGGVVNILAVLAFVVLAVVSVARGAPPPSQRRPRDPAAAPVARPGPPPADSPLAPAPAQQPARPPAPRRTQEEYR